MLTMRMKEKNQVTQLAIPIFIELFLFMIMGNVDAMMLSGYSDLAVAAVSNANQMMNAIVIIFNVGSSATGIILNQCLGAKQEKHLNQLLSLAFFASLIGGIALGFVLLTNMTDIFKWLKVPVEIYHDTGSYLKVSFSFLWVPALYMLLSVVMKSFKKTKITMGLAVLMNIVNIIGNYAALYGTPFSHPVGVSGLAMSTVFGRFLAVVIMLYILFKKLHRRIGLSYLAPFPGKLALQMLKLGAPAAAEPFSYQMSQIIVFSMVNSLGTEVITARMYVKMITYASYIGSMALAQASQIMAGHMIGAKNEDEAKNLVLKSLGKGWLLTLSISVLFAVFGAHIMGIFTQNNRIVALGAKILIYDIGLEMGRVANLIVIGGLKAAGDVHYPMMAGMVTMWLVSVGGAHLFGSVLGLGLIGIWTALMLDECIRGALMIQRWKKGKWRDRLVTVLEQ